MWELAVCVEQGDPLIPVGTQVLVYGEDPQYPGYVLVKDIDVDDPVLGFPTDQFDQCFEIIHEEPQVVM